MLCSPSMQVHQQHFKAKNYALAPKSFRHHIMIIVQHRWQAQSLQLDHTLQVTMLLNSHGTNRTASALNYDNNYSHELGMLHVH